MKEVAGNIWDYHPRTPIAVTTNGSINQAGQAVMGRGIAYQAARKYGSLPLALAKRLQSDGNHVYWFVSFGLFTFPVKHQWHQKAGLVLIQRSCHELMRFIDEFEFSRVVIPRPGCGNGGLDWDLVRPVIDEVFDDRVTVVSLPAKGT